jgi:hypothetical protein
MRTASFLSSQFWIGETGKALHGHLEAQLTAAYLATSPHSYAYGLYYITERMIGDEIGLTVEQVRTALELLDGLDYARYDPHSQYVWVVNMAHYQLALPLHDGDNKIIAVNNWYRRLPRNPFLGPFYDRYAADCQLQDRRGGGGPPPNAGPLLRDVSGPGSPFDAMTPPPPPRHSEHAELLDRLKLKFPKYTYHSWFRPLRAGPINGTTIIFVAHNDSVKQYIERHYGEQLREACAEIGHPELTVNIITGAPR